MSFKFRRREFLGDLSHEAARLKTLTDELKRMVRRKLPGLRELATAPLLKEWRFAAIQAPCLVGLRADHPSLHRRSGWRLQSRANRAWPPPHKVGQLDLGVHQGCRLGEGRNLSNSSGRSQVSAEMMHDGSKDGRIVVLRDRDGEPLAVDAGSVGAMCETDDSFIMLLPGGRMIRVERSLFKQVAQLNGSGS